MHPNEESFWKISKKRFFLKIDAKYFFFVKKTYSFIHKATCEMPHFFGSNFLYLIFKFCLALKLLFSLGVPCFIFELFYIGSILYWKYFVFKVFYIWSILYLKYFVFEVFCIWSILYLKYFVFEVFYIRSILYLKYFVFEVFCIQSILNSKSFVFEVISSQTEKNEWKNIR